MSTSQSINTLIRAFLAIVLAAFWLLLNPQLAQAQQGELNTGNRIAEKLKNLKLPVLGKKDSSATEETEEEESEEEVSEESASDASSASESPNAPDVELGGASDSDAAGTGKKKGVFNRFLSAFRSKKSGEESTESQSVLEVQRKVSQLERDSLRNYDRNRLSEAKKNLNDLITLRPYEVNYHFALALCFRKENRTQDALKKYQDVIDLGGPKPLIHLLMAEARTRKGTKKEIFKELEQAATARNIFHDVNILKALQKYNTDTDFIKLALSLEKIELVSKRGQDPMTNPFRARLDRTGDKPDELGNDKTDLPIEGQKQLYADARKAYEKVIWLIKLEDEEGAMENYGILNAKLAKSELVTIPRIRHDFQRLASMMEELESQIEGIRLKYYYRQALDKLKIMKQAFYDAEYAQVESIFTQVKKLAEDMEETNDQYKPVAAQVLKAGNVWIERTRVRQEFDANKPQIQGVIISSQSKQVVINGRIIPQGERIGKFKVQKVENNKITFRYKGEEIPLIFRRY